jgi:hypothetical protein
MPQSLVRRLFTEGVDEQGARHCLDASAIRPLHDEAEIHRIVQNLIYTGEFIWLGKRYQGSQQPSIAAPSSRRRPFFAASFVHAIRTNCSSRPCHSLAYSLFPWKPDARQAAQKAMFLCVANPVLSFVENLAPNSSVPGDLRQIVAPMSREETLYRLSTMNVTAATMFPDLGGLARSLRTHPLRLSVLAEQAM